MHHFWDVLRGNLVSIFTIIFQSVALRESSTETSSLSDAEVAVAAEAATSTAAPRLHTCRTWADIARRYWPVPHLTQDEQREIVEFGAALRAQNDALRHMQRLVQMKMLQVGIGFGLICLCCTGAL